MKTERIIEAIRNTKTLEGTRIGLAAHLAESGRYRDCIEDVHAFWERQGGTVDDKDEALAAGVIG